jgi:aminoglycoside 6'-N-acetyltransferase I
MRITEAENADAGDWIALRAALWPEAEDHAGDIARILAEPAWHAAFIARDADGVACGFAEVSLRHDYVDGCVTSPVGFLEGIYVDPAHRRLGTARALAEAVQSWVTARGCSEFASNALLDNTVSHLTHGALGFEETERMVMFRKVLRQPR